jgi:hypothetical protein
MTNTDFLQKTHQVVLLIADYETLLLGESTLGENAWNQLVSTCFFAAFYTSQLWSFLISRLDATLLFQWSLQGAC